MKLVKLLFSLCALFAFTFCSKDNNYKSKNGVNANDKVTFKIYKIDESATDTKTRSAVIDLLSGEDGEPYTATCTESLANKWCAVSYHGHNKVEKGAVGLYQITNNGPILKYIISTDEARINFVESSYGASAPKDKLYIGLDAVHGNGGKVGIAEIDMDVVKTLGSTPFISNTVTFPGLSINAIGVYAAQKEMIIAYAPYGEGKSGFAQLRLDDEFCLTETVNFHVDPLFAQNGRALKCMSAWTFAGYWADKNDIAHSYVDVYKYDKTKFSTPTFGNDEPIIRIDLWEGETPAAKASNKCGIRCFNKSGRMFFFVGYDKFRVYSIPATAIKEGVKASVNSKLVTLDYSENKMVHSIFDRGNDVYVGYTDKIVRYEFNADTRSLTPKAEFSLNNGASLNYCHVLMSDSSKLIVAYGTSGLVVLNSTTLKRIGN